VLGAKAKPRAAVELCRQIKGGAACGRIVRALLGKPIIGFPNRVTIKPAPKPKGFFSSSVMRAQHQPINSQVLPIEF
jgi:hypothetical protein